jgi:hypothetical protein
MSTSNKLSFAPSFLLEAGVASALVAYEVHTAAGVGWRAVFGIRPDGAATEDAVKKQYWRTSLVHPDKARSCAAAEGAFKLIRQACEDVLASVSSSSGGRE